MAEQSGYKKVRITTYVAEVGRKITLLQIAQK